jgi:hypothetical protein
LVQIVERRRLKAKLQTLISNFRAALFISINAVCNEVELRDVRAAHAMAVRFRENRIPRAGTGFNLLATDYRQLTTDDKETKEIRQVFIYFPVGSLQSPVVSLHLVPAPTLFINPFNIFPTSEEMLRAGSISSNGRNFKRSIISSCVSSDINEPWASERREKYSLFVFLPSPSAMYDGTLLAKFFILLDKPKFSLGGSFSVS